MNEMLLNIISVVVSAIVLPLISIGGTQLIKLINSKIKNQEASKLLSDATSIVLNAVRTVTQTYVDTLKANGSFNKDAQLVALNKAKDIALFQMSTDVKDFINVNFGDVQLWITNQIEASINLLKGGN